MLPSLKVVRCPTCRAKHPDLIEIWAGRAMTFYFDGEAYMEGVAEGEGEPIHIEGSCRECGRKWKLRNVTLGDLIGV